MVGAPIPRPLLAKIVDEVFDGAIEDPTVIEDIYRVIVREQAGDAVEDKPPVSGWIHDALKQAHSQIESVCMEFGCQQGQDMHEFLREKLTAAVRLDALINNPQTADFLSSVRSEAAHQRERWGAPHDRSKSAENWFWLVGYLAGKCLRACINGDKPKALHHTISAGAALANWYEAIKFDDTPDGTGQDSDIRPGNFSIRHIGAEPVKGDAS